MSVIELKVISGTDSTEITTTDSTLICWESTQLGWGKLQVETYPVLNGKSLLLAKEHEVKVFFFFFSFKQINTWINWEVAEAWKKFLGLYQQVVSYLVHTCVLSTALPWREITAKQKWRVSLDVQDLWGQSILTQMNLNPPPERNNAPPELLCFYELFMVRIFLGVKRSVMFRFQPYNQPKNLRGHQNLVSNWI